MQVLFTESTKTLSLSDLGTRFVALLIDILLLSLILLAVNYFTISSDENVLLLKPELLLYVLLWWLYFAGTETCACQATLGKYMMGLQVKNSAGGRLSFINAGIRYFAKPLTLFVLLFRFITGAGLPPHQLLHDRLAGAQVAPRS